MILVSSTEPATFHPLGKLSTAPERYGVDFMWTVKGKEGTQRFGVQRKEINDFIASLADDRLAKETAQMASLHRGILVIEGKLRWTSSGHLILKSSRYVKQRWTRAAFTAMLLSLQDRGWWVLFSQDILDTAKTVKVIEHWSMNDHDSLSKRAAMVSPWGTNATDREYACWVLQSAPGIGPDTAKNIVDALGSVVKLTVTEEELLGVKGVGAKTVENLRKAFG